MKIALARADREPDGDAIVLPNKHATAELIHVTANGKAFVADENSPADVWLYIRETAPVSHENKYLWHVNVVTSDADTFRNYWYLIDANSGQVIANN